MDRSLDEIVAETQQSKRGNRSRRGGGGGGRNGGGGRPAPRERDSFRDSYPRDGVRKSYRDDSRGVDTDWVHDKFDDTNPRNRSNNSRRRRSPEPYQDNRGAKVRVENLHYDLSREDLQGLFSKIGPIVKLELVYDRAGRSEGIAYVTYDRRDDASEAIREFDGANAKGQPIRMSIVTSGPRRNPFDNAYMPGRLADRITRPRSLSPGDRRVDRYVPGGGGSRSRSPLPQRRGGRRPGARRENGGGENRGGGRGRDGRGRDGRPKKTQEELDAEMADYFGGVNTAPAETDGAYAGQTADLTGDDVDMIE
ncbi:Uu.00g019950.m01.CDS01 [Anthostomella pinea]|uniref:Uu.00g019950.m01.CDS01 n=1 Tax=Anthostomella pinea TaxID=933095 RepID=A0AAI8VZE6_9PEZI|nr:Uu.00g019950.m01.CDS01 [Anthostomella pinea]